MKKIKITVLKTTLNDELVKEYGIKDLTPCPFLKEGQYFITDFSKPEGFCDEAWKAISHYAFALAHGNTEPFYGGQWVREAGTAITCCNDGLRPVIFKMEVVDK